MMHTIYLGLGSNQGDKKKMIDQALVHLAEYGDVVSVSPLYETEPFGILDQEWFLNGVCELRSTLSLPDLLSAVQKIENTLLRVRTVKNGPRTIDIDILFYDDIVYSTDDLVVPHIGILDRWCVLKPLSDIAPHYVHPAVQKSITELLHSLEEKNAKGKERH